MATFTNPTINGSLRTGFGCDSGAHKTFVDRRGRVQLGDGYTLPYSRGLKPLLDVWNLSWTGLLSDLRPANDFLRAEFDNNSEYFNWVDPISGENKRWWCDEFQLKNVKGIGWRLTAKFVETP